MKGIAFCTPKGIYLTTLVGHYSLVFFLKLICRNILHVNLFISLIETTIF